MAAAAAELGVSTVNAQVAIDRLVDAGKVRDLISNRLQGHGRSRAHTQTAGVNPTDRRAATATVRAETVSLGNVTPT